LAALIAIIVVAIIVLEIYLRSAKRVDSEDPSGSRAASRQETTFRKLRTPVTGAFGFVLGERLDNSVNVSTFEDNHNQVDFSVAVPLDYGAAVPITSGPPFDSISVHVLQERRIVSINARYSGIFSATKVAAELQTVRTALEEKYGLPTVVNNAHQDDSRVYLGLPISYHLNDLIWRDDHCQLTLASGFQKNPKEDKEIYSWFNLEYLDLNLNSTYIAERTAPQIEMERKRQAEETKRVETVRTNL
jgi:hypothetical protein